MELLYKFTKVNVEVRYDKYAIQVTHTQKEGPIVDSLLHMLNHLHLCVFNPKPSATPEKQEKINTQTMSKGM